MTRRHLFTRHLHVEIHSMSRLYQSCSLRIPGIRTLWEFNMEHLRTGLFLRWSWWSFKSIQDYKLSLQTGNSGLKKAFTNTLESALLRRFFFVFMRNVVGTSSPFRFHVEFWESRPLQVMFCSMGMDTQRNVWEQLFAEAVLKGNKPRLADFTN